MTVYDKMMIDILLAVKTTRGEMHIVVGQWASQYGVEERFAREKLVQLHQDKIIRLSAFHESKGVSYRSRNGLIQIISSTTPRTATANECFYCSRARNSWSDC
jgi:hypothetical protein